LRCDFLIQREESSRGKIAQGIEFRVSHTSRLSTPGIRILFKTRRVLDFLKLTLVPIIRTRYNRPTIAVVPWLIRLYSTRKRRLVLSIRPTVTEHIFSVFGRSIHPELFANHRTRCIERAKYRARIDITSDGHVVTFTGSRGATISEVIGSVQQPLPQQRRLLALNLRGKYAEELHGKRGLKYRSQFELEHISADMFWMLQNQLQSCCSADEMIHTFDSSGRMPFGAISFVHLETRERQLLVQAFHTFPDDYAIVKSTSTFCVEAS